MGRMENTRRRRMDVIEAALRCFTELGYAKTTLAKIRAFSEASTGSIYHHFKSKERLAAAVYLEGIRSYQGGLLKALETESGARAGVTAIVGYHLEWVRAHPDWARYLMEMRHAEFMAGAEPDFKELNLRFAAGLTAWVTRHMKARHLRPFPRDVFLSLLLGPCQEYTRQWLVGAAVLGPGEAAAMLAEAVWLTLKGDRAETAGP